MSPIRVIGADGSQIGVVETPQAIRMAEEQGLDLVEISPDTRPPVCKIMDFGKFKYEQSKQNKNKGAKASELKEVRLGRSVKIDPHDVEIRVKQARRFLMDGHKVMITQKFKGREMAHRELGVNRLREIRDKLSDIAKCETEPRWMGPQASIIMAPDKHKAEAAKRAEQKAKKDEEKAEIRAGRRMEDEAARLAAANGTTPPPEPEDIDEPAEAESSDSPS
jgi:translation initiation factor IF-3